MPGHLFFYIYNGFTINMNKKDHGSYTKCQAYII